MATIETLVPGFSIQTSQGSPGLCSITLVRGAKNTVIDVGHVGRRSMLLAALAARGLSPADVDQVFLTHAHWDHSQNVDLFPNAEILLHPAEREYVADPHESDWATPRWTTLMLEAQKVREVRDGEEIDDGVTVLSVPGHSRGSMAALIRTDSGTIAVSGDAMNNGWSASIGMPRLVFWNEDEARRSVGKILDSADVFYPGHDGPFQVATGNVHYLGKREIKVFCSPDPGKDTGLEGIPVSHEIVRPNIVRSVATV